MPAGPDFICMKRTLLLFAITLLGLDFTLMAQPTNPAAEVSIQLEPGTIIAPVADDFVGFGYETAAVARVGVF